MSLDNLIYHVFARNKPESKPPKLETSDRFRKSYLQFGLLNYSDNAVFQFGFDNQSQRSVFQFGVFNESQESHFQFGFSSVSEFFLGFKANVISIAKQVYGVSASLFDIVEEELFGVQIGLICYANKGTYLQLGLITRREDSRIPFTPFIGFHY